MEKGTTLLQAINLSIGYTAKKQAATIASNINLELKAGSLTALIGANGIGKSTLLRTLTGIQQPLSGNVLLNNMAVAEYSAQELSQNLSIVLTEALPPSNLTVFELVALGRQPYTNWLGSLSDDDFTKVNIALKLTQTAHLSHKKHFEISDGQLQKVLIARALAQDTPLIILDEPTTHLDLLHKVNLLRLLKKLAQEANKCILYSTHDLDLALQLSDRIIVMTPQTVVQGTPQNLIDNNVFDTLFNDANIVFDKDKGGFVVK
ncbi:ABC transporter ATP-binding protein [Flavobacterium subsaxonicum]|uniref:ABC transporter ATP-binding protein n=1 Tax=Flavobacterium subsaxonicum WB 4.1-42 = DSM 21790 TaxID=1121898 RepID=A0A0A2MXW7_9FLAO|nr:ABC transporter ATP-binding protein [Flavobacterium subsaxonicum]KGO93065.1 ABC transporter ATP-binding protein [Flavobacterium subsaxonicum WB 4.1-42 = DSM 21790]